ncbi:response regulator transcription factor [Diaphorobacter sp. HDW4A]|nr:response regulator transcription factor [Diaphorobacter sp. HDW4A]
MPHEKGVILVVDDAPDTLALLCDTLDLHGYTVLVATDGESAIQRLAYVIPDAILLDGVMPGASGFETCRRIKAEPAWAHIPVIFMTGLAETENIVAGFDSGGVDYVVKPVREAEILARLTTHARNARISRMVRDAVDVAGTGSLIVDAQGRIAWVSPLAQGWLATLPRSHSDAALPDAIHHVLTKDDVLHVTGDDGRPLCIRNLGCAALGETMLLLSQTPEPQRNDRLADARLTPRETEVLSWLAKGKTNRDISEILSMSPRTVSKHLEHIFEKLGVETRSAAAALASGAVA